jgi:hypothetical protein
MKKKQSGKSRVRRFFKWGLILAIVVLAAARLLLPYIVLRYVNDSLSEMKGYKGHVDDIDIRLIRGAYVIDKIIIFETDNELKGKDSIPFFSALKIDLSLDWRSVFHKRIVGVVKMYNPVINFKNKKSDQTTVKNDTADFSHLIQKIMPLTINSLKIENGELHYIDRYSSPRLDILMDSITSTASNLSNVTNKKDLMPAKIIANGNCYGGTFKLDVNLDLLSKFPTFDLNTELKNLDLTRVNDFLRAYANFDVSKGNFTIFAEFAARNGKFNGYIKPLLSDLDVVQWNKEEGNIPQIIWETFVAGVGEVITNQKKDQLATKLNIEGDFKNTKIGVLKAVKYLLINAYIEALKPKLDNTINIKINALNSEKKTGKEKRIERKNKKMADSK